MSWDISLNDKNENAVMVGEHFEGGIYAINGCNEADLNVTYNYGKYFKFRDLHYKKGKEVIELLETAIKSLGTKKDNDYWKPTKGNVGHCLNVLLKWAKQYPKAIFRVY